MKSTGYIFHRRLCRGHLQLHAEGTNFCIRLKTFSRDFVMKKIQQYIVTCNDVGIISHSLIPCGKIVYFCTWKLEHYGNLTSPFCNTPYIDFFRSNCRTQHTSYGRSIEEKDEIKEIKCEGKTILRTKQNRLKAIGTKFMDLNSKMNQIQQKPWPQTKQNQSN